MDHGPASHVSEPPTVDDERKQRQYHRQRIALLFAFNPLKEITADELRHITPHYHQRISELRVKHKMNIRNVPQWIARADGSKEKRDGSYIFKPYQELGPASDQFRAQKRLF